MRRLRRRLVAAPLLVVLAGLPAGPAAADVPLVLSPTGEGAEMQARVAADAGAWAAALRLPAMLERERLGGGLSLDLGGVTVGGAFRGDLGAVFGRPSELRAAGAGPIADWLGEATGLVVARSSGALSGRLAVGRDQRSSLGGRLVAAEMGLAESGYRLTLRAAQRGSATRLVGGEARVSLGDGVAVELAGAVEKGPLPKRQTGLALEWRGAALARDRLRAQFRRTKSAGVKAIRQVRIRYGAPMEVGRLGVKGEARRDFADYRASAEWRLAF